MRITVELPDDVSTRPDGGRAALEAFAIAGYRQGVFSEFDLARLLGLARLQVDDFLTKYGVEDHAYDAADLERDREAVRQMRAESLMHQ